MREWSVSNKDRIKGYNNDESTFRASRKVTCARYGITPEDYDQMFEDQNGVCAICFEPETLIRRGTLCKLTIDHDHETGQVRGLLCNNCNRALGLFNDKSWVLRSAATYLENFEY